MGVTCIRSKECILFSVPQNHGPVKGGRLDFGGKSFAVKDLAAGEEHVLKLPLAYSGVIPVSFAATAAECRIGAVKRYLKHSKNGD